MFGPSVTRGFRVAPRSTVDIRRHAMHVREVFGLIPSIGFFRMDEFIESLYEFAVNYDVVEQGELPQGVEACCVPEQRLIMLTQNTYDQACRDSPRARFTVIHELGHLALSHTRGFHRDQRGGEDIKAYEDSEWQANAFAAEFLMPATDVAARRLWQPVELMMRYQVSEPAATKRLRDLTKQGLLQERKGR
jgi:hypothetical protein